MTRRILVQKSAAVGRTTDLPRVTLAPKPLAAAISGVQPITFYDSFYTQIARTLGLGHVGATPEAIAEFEKYLGARSIG